MSKHPVLTNGKLTVVGPPSSSTVISYIRPLDTSSLERRPRKKDQKEKGEGLMASSAGEVSGECSAAKAAALQGIMEGISSDDVNRRIEAAKEIRRLTRTSTKHRRQLSGSIESLVSMLRAGGRECSEVAILALLNLAVKDER